MAKRKGSSRSRASAADEPLRRGRTDDRPPAKKPLLADKTLRGARRESEILPGIPLS